MGELDVTLLVDGNNLLVRAVKAMERVPLSEGGVSTGPLLVFVNMLSRYVKEVDPDYVVVCWDGGRSSHRTMIFPDYKISRAEHDDGRDPHFALAKEFLDLCAIHHVQEDGVEADDLIAAYCQKLAGMKVILSGDKDFLQLLDSDTTQIRPTGANELWTHFRVEDELGCKPENLPLAMALTGDASDGVPGVPKVGQKTACKLLSKYDWNLAELLEADLPILSGHRELVVRNIQLVDLRSTITWTIPVTQPPRFAPTDPSGNLLRELLAFFARYKLRSIRDRFIAGQLWKGSDG